MTLQSERADTDEIRQIEAEAAPTRFARGWHCLGLTRDFGDGTPHAIHAFGQKLVVFRGGDGKINVLDAYCRHMGGDLSQGTVKGDEIACPFHDWRWGGDGRCKSVPYARRVPAAGPHRDMAHARTGRHAVRLERPGGQPAAARRWRFRGSRARPVTSGPTGSGTRPSSTPTAARSSTTSSTWRTSSISTARSRRTSRTSSRGTSPPST